MVDEASGSIARCSHIGWLANYFISRNKFTLITEIINVRNDDNFIINTISNDNKPCFVVTKLIAMNREMYSKTNIFLPRFYIDNHF